LKNVPSTREWWGMLGAAAWGAMLGALRFGNGDATVMWIAVLVGPPIAFLLLPTRPFLSWQLCMTAAALSATYRDRDPQDPSDGVLVPALLGWTAFCLLSLPWPFIFQRRAERARAQGDISAGVTMRYVGVGLLVFLTCGLMIVGGIFLYFANSGTEQVIASGHAASFIGCVAASAGIGLSAFLCRRADDFRINKSAEDLFGLLLTFTGFFVVGIALTETFFKSSCSPGESCAPVRGSDVFWTWIVAIETVAVLVWLIRRGIRRKAIENAARASER